MVGDERIPLAAMRRIAVVGAGKAGAGMAAAVEDAARPHASWKQKQLTGWVNVPADCVRPLARIHLHAARPAGRERADGRRRGRRGGDPAAGRVARPGRPVPVPDLRRRLGPAAGPGRGHDAGRQAGRHAASQRGRGQHRRTEHGPQAAQPDQGRRAGPGLPRRPARDAHHLRRAGRSAGRDRLRADGRGLVARRQAALAVLEQFAARQAGISAGRVRVSAAGTRAAERRGRRAA